MAVTVLAIAFYVGRTAVSSLKEARSLPYVPPVAEQISALPAEKILVRCSNEPTATPEELLRAAQARAEQPAEELLRADDLRSAHVLPVETTVVQRLGQ
jgi:hypothetical protein